MQPDPAEKSPDRSLGTEAISFRQKGHHSQRVDEWDNVGALPEDKTNTRNKVFSQGTRLSGLLCYTNLPKIVGWMPSVLYNIEWGQQ